MATAKITASVISNHFLDFTGSSAGVDVVGLVEGCGAVCGLLRGFFTGGFLFCGVLPSNDCFFVLFDIKQIWPFERRSL